MEMKIKRRMLYTRVTPMLVSRSGRCSNLGMFIGICFLVSICCFMSFLSGKVTHTSNPNVAARLAELSTWGVNHSLNIQEYVDIGNADSFIWQPQGIINSNNSTPSFCGAGEDKLLIIVTSAPSHFIQREAIRETWGSKQELSSKHAKLFFILGRSENETLEEDVAREVADFGDIIEEDFLDTYHNLTLKSIAMLKWINLTCYGSNNSTRSSMPQYVLKTDDDVFINIDRLFSVISEKPGAEMIGRLICGAEPISDVKSKLFMPQYLYPGKTYPAYLSGTAYFLTGAIVPRLLETAVGTPLIHMEDIYITGIVARKDGIYPEDSPAFTYLKVSSKDMCVLREMVNSHTIQPPEMHKIWDLRNHYNFSKCASILTPKLRRKLIRRPVPRVKSMNKRLKKLCMFPLP